MITSVEQYKKALAYFIREEEDGIKKYAKLVKSLPHTQNFNSVRQSLRRIASDEKDHVVILKRLLAQVL